MEEDPALQLLKKYNRDYKERRPRKSLRLHFELAIADLLSRGYLKRDCSANLRYAMQVTSYRRALQRVLRETREPDLRREIERELWLTLSILASIGVLCGREAEGDVKAMLIDTVQRFNARFEACYQFKNTRSCVKARLEPMLEGARSPALILSLLR